MAVMRFDVGPLSHTKTVSAGDLTRLENACRKQFGMEGATSQQVATALASWLWQQLIGMVKTVESREAADAASNAVEDIDLT